MGLRSDRQRVVHPQNEVMPKGKFIGASNYNENYIPSQIVANKPFRVEGELKVGGKFEGNSNYAENYFQKPISNKEEKVASPQNMVIPQGKFEAVSTYSGNYVNNPISHILKIKPEG